MKNTKKVLLAVVACSVLCAGAIAVTACNSGKSEHVHNWSEWTVTDANKPGASATGKATRTCNADGCDASASDKEYTLPALSSEDYVVSDNTATCVEAGTATYSYSKNEVTVSFTAVTNAKGHTYGETYTLVDETLHSQTCEVAGCGYVNKQQHVPAVKSDETYHWDVCVSCTYEGEKAVHTINKTKYDEENHWTGCSYEGCAARNEETVTPHDYENNIKSTTVTKHPTPTEQGEKDIECQCGHKKTFKFDGVVSTCDLTSLYTAEFNRFGVETSRTSLIFIEGKYYHLRDSKPIYLNLSSTVATVEFYYSTDGENYTDVPFLNLDEDYPVSCLFDGENDRYSVIITTDEEVKIKADIYVTEESIAVEKQFTITPVPILETPKVYVYSETEFAYGWTDIANTTIYLGQQLNIKAFGYNVTLDGEELTINAQGETTIAPQTAGEYVLTITSPYNANDSYTATITVNEAADIATILSGNYAGGGYTVAFGDNNTITVSKDGEEDITLTYTYTDGVFTTSGSETVSILLTPTYKLFIVVGEQKTELILADKYTNEIYTILGGTSWTKVICNTTQSVLTTLIDVVVTFHSDGTGSITKTQTMIINGNTSSVTSGTFNFNYFAEQTAESYKLSFEFVSASDNNKLATYFEIGDVGDTGDKKTSNNFSIINKYSNVIVDGETVSLSLWLKTGTNVESTATEQAVTFDKVVEE